MTIYWNMLDTPSCFGPTTAFVEFIGLCGGCIDDRTSGLPLFIRDYKQDDIFGPRVCIFPAPIGIIHSSITNFVKV